LARIIKKLHHKANDIKKKYLTKPKTGAMKKIPVVFKNMDVAV